MGDVTPLQLLLDSHCLLWWEQEVERLSLRQKSAIEDSRNEIYVSAATAWELGIKRAKGKLKMVRSVAEMIDHFGFRDLPVSVAHAERAAGLPLLHGDPFDRMLAAQALMEGLTLMTADSVMERYGVSVLK